MAPTSFTLELQEYESLIALAREGVKDSPDRSRQLDSFLRLIEKKNGIVRDAIWVQWTETGTPLATTAKFPDSWPPEQRFLIELVSRRVARADVDAVLQQRAKMPIDVLVTRDLGARVGWQTLDDYFLTG